MNIAHRVQLRLLWLLIGIATSSDAATFEVISVPEFDNIIIVMSGETIDGDAQRFFDLTESLGSIHATVNVQGPGGLVNEALDIAAQIRIKHYATMVSSQTECYSACALIWLAGERRYLAADSIIGVHAAFRQKAGDLPEESGVANARIGAYLNMIGLPLDAITYVTTAPPDEVLPITPAIARSIGIEVYEQDGMGIVTPDVAPTAHVIARNALETIAVSINCSDLLQLDGARVMEIGKDIFRRSHKMFGGERMADLISWMSSEIRSKIEQVGYPIWCIKTVPMLHAEGIQFGFDGPSYNCALAVTPSERLICKDPSLWAWDRAMYVIYTIRRKSLAPALKTRLRNAQHDWITWRDNCASDKSCVIQAYRLRLKDLGVE